MSTRRVQAGEALDIGARTWNSLMQLLEQRDGVGSRFTETLDVTTCLVQNATPSDMPLYGVVGIGQPLILPSDNEDEYLNNFAFMGTLPTVYSYRWGITLEPIAVGDVGRIRVAGLTQCYINLSTDQAIDFAKPDDVNGTTDALIRADCGARVMWREAGTGAQRAIVIL